MMFASDLDRTLIYSKKALKDFPIKESADLIPIEQKLGENVSFMTKKSYTLLQEIASKLLFVPVTTRSLEQYQRILFQDLPILYAVTTNGANILYKGEPLFEWDKYIKEQMELVSFSMGKLTDALNEHFRDITGSIRNVEDTFIYFYLNAPIGKDLFNRVRKFAEEEGWRVSLQGKKLYFIPAPITKGNAIKFIQEREGKTTLIGAGDSVFDDDFLQHCQHPFVPRHGELAGSNHLRESYTVTSSLGIQGGEELLASIDKLGLY